MNPQEKINILLVDDHPQNLLSLEALLDSPDYHLVKAHSGKEALKHLLKEDFALILLDVRMPDIDGLETAKLIKQREQSKYIPIIFLTALQQDEQQLFEGYSAGAVDYVLKPFNPLILRSKVSVFVDLYKKNRKLLQEQKERLNVEAARRRLSAQYAVTRVLAESTTLKQAAPKIIQAICDSLTWELGVIWLVDKERYRLRYVEIWHKPSEALAAFEEVCRKKTFLVGEGLPGRIWANGEPAWISDVVEDANFPREGIAIDEGLHAAFGFPIRGGTDLLGVIEFFSHEIREPDADVLQLMASIGSSIGQFIERKQAERATQESEARKTAILESALDCIITMDHQGRVIEFNPASERTFGFRRDEVIGKEMAELIIPPALREKHREGLAHYLATENGPILGKRIEMTAIRANGAEFPVELAVTRIPLDGPPLFTGYLRDITQRKEAEESLEQRTIEAQEASRLKSQFVSNVSHELRTPINSILGYASLLLDETYGPVGDEQKTPLEGVVRNASDLLALVNDVLDLSKIEAGKLLIHIEALNLPDLLKGIIIGMKPLLDQKPIQLKWKGFDRLPPIESDVGKIKQIFTNLFSNAVKFTSKGSITVTGKNLPERKGIEIALQDTGIGIKAEELPKLFNAFHQVDAELTRAYGGVGLGLRIVKDLVHLLQGEIRVESSHGEGSTFTVFLPVRLNETKQIRQDKE
ncbi:MAG: PAS domain S-box protein [Candidatus Manganitrophus sp. SB1]|nr:PAS domain S-box protein [Candidatus Manganitrophus morganii]